MSSEEEGTFTPVCRVEQVPREGGVSALVQGASIAIIKTHDGNVHAIGNYDPCGRAAVLSRGIVGTRGDVPFVASPLHKQAYDLRTGQCLDDAAVRVPTYDVRVADGIVHVGPRLS